jgi:hypothetical protein
MWPWREWVIQAYHENKPFDEFITWQLAGDLLPDATYEQKLATGFNRNHSINQEGGIIDEEFRVEYVADRTNTLGAALLGLTLECARCHDHKFDPISQKNYYELYSFFNSVPEKLQQLVPDTISRNEALRLYRIVSKVNEAVEIAKRISKYSTVAKKRYFDALTMDPTAPHATIRRMANHFKDKQNIRLKLTMQQAKGFSKAATDNPTEPNELAAKIVSEWLSKKGYI